MNDPHIAFFLDPAYGNTIPSFGIAMELMRRGHRISYIVNQNSAPLIRSIGATPLVIDLLEIRQQVLDTVLNDNDHLNYRTRAGEGRRFLKEQQDKRTHHALPQLDELFSGAKPDLIIHDDCLDTAGRSYAVEHGLPKVRLATQFINENDIESYREDETILVTVPRFFHRRLELFDADPRFRFIGFVAEGRCQSFQPWQPLQGTHPRILLAPTTGLLQQVAFCKMAVESLRDQPWDIVLSVSATHDKLSAFEPSVLGELPDNVQLNHHAGNFDVLRNVDLFIGQAGQGSALEAIYWGVPQILLPPTPYHYLVAQRVSELGLGICLPIREMSRETLAAHVTALLADKVTQARIQEARNSMREHSGAKIAADILEERLAK
jgi:UDP:flavonoid glycosyltransferase YjiC (YdhE family)